MKKIDISRLSEVGLSEKVREVGILAAVHHPHIVKYYDSFIEASYLYLIMEYCEKGDLETFLSSQQSLPLTETKIFKYFFQLCLALDYLHSKGIIHRDLKPRNVLLTRDFTLKLADFGVIPNYSLNKYIQLFRYPQFLRPRMRKIPR